jgi:uncharacterized membrane protein (DUF4010 family)
MDPLSPFLRLGAALAIGFLIGFERGWRKRDEPEGTRAAGLRTFSLIGLVGGIAGWLGEQLGEIVIAAGFVAVAGFAVAMYWASVRADARIGATTEVSALVTYALGALAGHGQIVLAVAAAVVVVVLLDTKAPLHGLLQRIRHDELRAALKLLAVSAVLLPILPNEGYGPGGILNPYRLWWFVVLVAGLSLAGHFAVRFAGSERGPVITGLVGGLVSSTAITASAARLARETPALAARQAACVAAAKGMMCMRVIVVAGVVNAGLLPVLIPPFAAAALAGFAAAYLFARRPAGEHDVARGHGPRAPASPPDDLGAAVIFAAALAAVMLASHYARQWFGVSGLYGTAALAGLVDVDAITVTAATLGDAAAAVAVAAILIAAAVNTLVKVAIAASLGPRGFALQVGAVVAAVLAAGAAGFVAALL